MRWRRHRRRSLAQSVLLLGAMATVAAALGRVLAGPQGEIRALVLSALLVVVKPQLSPRLILRLYGARPLAAETAPGSLRARPAPV